MPDPPGPEPSVMDLALLRSITDALERLPPETATLAHTWVAPAGMWTVEVRPRAEGAAILDVAFDGNDILYFTIGNIWFEVFPVRSVDDLTYAKEIAEAVFAGRVEESGRPSAAHGRLLLDDGPVGIGELHLPWPWKARPLKRRYAPYV